MGKKKDKTRFQQKKFSDAVKDKMFTDMKDGKKRIGVRDFAIDAKVSPATLSRVSNGKMPDLETFFRLCVWLKKDPKDFCELN